MFAIRTTSRVSAVAAAAGACLLLSACGGGSNGSSASGSSPQAAPAGAPTKGLLTGDFCKDYNGLGKAIVPTGATSKKIESSPSAAADLMAEIAADFYGLGKEAPAAVGKAMTTISAQYTALSAEARSGKTLAEIEKTSSKLPTAGPSATAFKTVSKYAKTTCSTASSGNTGSGNTGNSGSGN